MLEGSVTTVGGFAAKSIAQRFSKHQNPLFSVRLMAAPMPNFERQQPMEKEKGFKEKSTFS